MKNVFFSLLLTFSAFSLQAVEAISHAPGLLGVALAEITSKEVREFQLPGEYGAMVLDVAPQGPAQKSGITSKDVIISYNGQRVESARALQRMVLETPANRTVEIKLIRDGVGVLAQPSLGAGKMTAAALPAPRAPKSLGVGIENIAPAVGQYLGLEEGVGVIVRAIKEESPAATSGLQEKDILVSINETGITSAQQLAEEIKNVTSYTATIQVIRGTEPLTVEVQL